MKILIASDIHGSAYWCEKMIERYWEEKAGKLLLLETVSYAESAICRRKTLLHYFGYHFDTVYKMQSIRILGEVF